MALTGPLAGARLVALDTSPFIDLIERNVTFFAAVVPIFAELDAGALQGVTVCGPAPAARPDRDPRSPADHRPQQGHWPGRDSAHDGTPSNQDLIPSALATNLSGLRLFFSTGDAKHDGEGGPAKKRPLRHLFGDELSSRPRPVLTPRPDDHRPGSAAGRDDPQLLPRSLSDHRHRGAAHGRGEDEHRPGGYATARGHSIRRRANTPSSKPSVLPLDPRQPPKDSGRRSQLGQH